MQKKHVYFAVAVFLCALVWAGATFWEKINRGFEAEADTWIKIPPESSEEDILEILKGSLGHEYGKTVHEIWTVMRGNPSVAPGAYKIKPGSKVLEIARTIKRGNQTPIKVTFNNIRLFEELGPRLANQLNFSTKDFLATCDSILPQHGFNQANFIGAFLPDTYEFYWLTSPSKTVNRLLGYYDSFWNSDRQKKAKKLGLTPQQVVTLASIVEEETNKNDERPIVARLYLNRLDRGMRLQADPTVKYAVGDFTLRRILQKHLQTESPYNTYLNNGLPPGPIRMPEASTIDAVLNAPNHDFIYMCAKEDFSGRHNFAKTLQEHENNAAKYRAALNAHGIR